VVFQTLILIVLAGGAGGLANSLIANRSLRSIENLGAVLLGALAGVVYWITEGPLDEVIIIPKPSTPPSVQLTWGDLGLVFALGTVGGKWLTDYADKRFFKQAASEAAAKKENERASASIGNARRGQEALTIVQSQMRE
jgi:hypothetical protein